MNPADEHVSGQPDAAAARPPRSPGVVLRYVFALVLLLAFAALLVYLALPQERVPKGDGVSVNEPPAFEPQTAPAGDGDMATTHLTAEEAHADSRIAFDDPETCGLAGCHGTIVAEWSSSYHAISGVDSVFKMLRQLENPGSGAPECRSCHMPGRAFAIGVLEIPKPRPVPDSGEYTGRDVHGTDCATCHVVSPDDPPVDGVAIGGASARIAGASDPVVGQALGTAEFCGGCHKSYLTGTLHEYDEWLLNTRPIEEKGTCLTCHGKPAEGGSVDGQSGTHVGHRFPGGHDQPMLASGIAVSGVIAREVEIDAAGSIGDRLTVTVQNLGTGHRFPTGYQVRRADVSIRVYDVNGDIFERFEYPLRKPPRSGGGGGGTQVYDQGSVSRAWTWNPDARLPDGGTIDLRVLYSPMPRGSDAEATVCAQVVLEIPDR